MKKEMKKIKNKKKVKMKMKMKIFKRCKLKYHDK